jgi:hypothetical protein
VNRAAHCKSFKDVTPGDDIILQSTVYEDTQAYLKLHTLPRSHPAQHIFMCHSTGLDQRLSPLTLKSSP